MFLSHFRRVEGERKIFFIVTCDMFLSHFRRVEEERKNIFYW